MQFGSVDHPQHIDFSMPQDHKDTAGVLSKKRKQGKLRIHVGCSQWSKSELKGFYPPGTKDALVYYSRQFNSIELNATFYRIFSPETVASWYDKTPNDFKFFPKVFQKITHWKRLEGIDLVIDDFLYSAVNLKEKLGSVFLQMPNNFGPKDFDKVEAFVQTWPKTIPVAIEFRHTDWHNDANIAARLYDLLETHGITNIIVDTAGRRDLMHMRLTNSKAFIRFVSANHESDYTRLDQWINRLKGWQDQGISEINFFIHQNIEKESPLLAAYFIKQCNQKLGTELTIPEGYLNPKSF